jgi:thiol-disulfide isomerase/thioredoxin
MPRILLGICAAAVIGTLVLYVIPSSRVHETAPDASATLRMDTAPKALPTAEFVDARGQTLSLSAVKGRLVILNLWATWCAPCVRELPALGHLAADSRIRVVAVNEGHDDAAKTAAFLKAHGAGNLSAYRDPELSLLEAFGSQGLPLSIVIDAKGREIARAGGPVAWDDPKVVAYFKALAAS